MKQHLVYSGGSGSQITLSPLGQEVVAELGDQGLILKENWDPDMKLRMKVAEVVRKENT